MEWNGTKWNHIDFYFLQDQPAGLTACQRMYLDWNNASARVWVCLYVFASYCVQFSSTNLLKFSLTSSKLPKLQESVSLCVCCVVRLLKMNCCKYYTTHNYKTLTPIQRHNDILTKHSLNKTLWFIYCV